MSDDTKNEGKFIVFEGGEGTGKTTQAKLLYDYLKDQNIPSIITREPGGTKQSEEIRELLINGSINKWDGISETLLHYAARREHINNVILPALKVGTWVICDRFYLSTNAYQGAGHGVDQKFLQTLKQCVCKDLNPNITFILDIKIEKTIKRILKRGKKNRYENFEKDFHNRVRNYFKNINCKQDNFHLLINADQPIKTINKIIISSINKSFINNS